MSQTFDKFGGRGFLEHYNSNVFELLKIVYPEIKWRETLREFLPKFFLLNLENQRWFLDDSTFFHVPSILVFSDVQKIEKKNFPYFIGGNFFVVLNTIYPEFNWNPSVEISFPKYFWRSEKFLNKVIQKLQHHFLINSKKDWYRLSHVQIREIFGREIKHTKITGMLRNIFPEESWTYAKFSHRNKKARQRWLFVQISQIFRNHVILEDFRPKELFQSTGTLVELDIFLPKLNLGFEFHGEQHFLEIPSAGFIPLYDRKSRDAEKIRTCTEFGIKLIIIPYWWDNKMESLTATICRELPGVMDIFEGTTAKPIPNFPPSDIFPYTSKTSLE